MNKLTLFSIIAIIIGVLASTHTHSAEINNSYSFNQLSASLCLAAKEDKPTQLRILLRQAKMHIRNIYADVRCHGETLLEVARRYHAEKVADYLRLKTKGLPLSNAKKMAVGG